MRSAFLFVIVLGLYVPATAQQSKVIPPEFADPPSAYRPSPFWSWNAALDDEELRWQVQEFKEKGYGGYFMHPRVGLVTRYLSEEWFHKIRVCLTEGQKLGLQSWIYDEDKWPSGFAGGLATYDHPEFASMGMGFRNLKSEEIPQALANPETLAAFDIWGGSYQRITDPGRKPEGQAVQFFAQAHEKSNWYNGEIYIDTLNPEAIAHFLKLTFTDGYMPRFQKDFGPAMPGVFTDEPNFDGRGGPGGTIFPWTRKLPEIFQDKRGYDLLEKLPCLTQPFPGCEQVRYDFWRTIAEQFETAYSKPYGEMLGKLGLKFTGHFLAEDNLSDQTDVAGSVMLQYLHQHIPGIDHLQRNISNPLTKKQASSVANQFGRTRVLSEIFGVSGHTASFEDLKWMADNHFVLGVNLLAPHLSLYAMAGDRKRDYPPTFSYHQPYWPFLKTLNDYLGRAAWFVTRGKSSKDILLLEPLGSVWAHWVPGEKKPEAVANQEQQFLATFNTLLEHHRDFDLGEELILERFGQVKNNLLKVGPEGEYQIVVIPPALRWNDSTAELLQQFLGAGGKVIVQGTQPEVMHSLASHRNVIRISENQEELGTALDKVVQRDISIADREGKQIRDILYQHRVEGKRHYFFLANTNREKTQVAVIHLPEELASGSLQEWDLATGTVRPAALQCTLPPVGSFAFTVDLSQSREEKLTVAKTAPVRSVLLKGPFAFSRTHPATLVLDYCRFMLNEEQQNGPVPVWKVREAAFSAAGLGAYEGLQPWALAWKGIKPSKTARVTMHFEFESELERPNAWLVIESAADYQVKMNGQPTPSPEGWHWDKQFGKIEISSLIHEGSNRIDMSTTYKPGVEIEDIFIIGDFATRKLSDTKYTLVAEPKELKADSWADQGYAFYSGNMIYRIPVEFKAGERISLRLINPKGTAFVVRAGNQEIARIGWQPWEAELTSALKPGKNLIELVVLGSLQNSFGPLHNTHFLTDGNDWWIGPDAFTDSQHWADAYTLAPYGLDGVEFVYSQDGR